MKRYYIASYVLFLVLIAWNYEGRSGFTRLAGFGERWKDRRISALNEVDLFVKKGSGGYDGQFYIQLATDPSLKNPEFENAIDAPSYRARRIFLPFVAYVLGLGKVEGVVQAYCLLNAFFWVVLSFVLFRWLPIGSLANFAKWFICMFSMGALESVRFSLVDLPSVTLMVGAIYLIERNRSKCALLSSALAVFTKETSVINLVQHLPLQRPWDTRKIIFAALVPGLICALYGLWILYVARIFPFHANMQGNLTLPFLEIFRSGWKAFAAIWEGDWDSRYLFRILAIFGLLFQFGYLFANHQFASPIWRWGILFGLLFIALGEYVWWGYWAVCRAALPMTIAFNILLETNRKPFFWPAIILSNLTMVHAFIRWV